MAATITVEDGTAVAGANSYISLADAEAYFETRLNGTEWDAALDDKKNRALIGATRVIDSLYTFKGERTLDTNALAWPRKHVYLEHDYLATTTIPEELKHAQCEQALAMLKEDRMTDPEGTGIDSVGLGKGAVSVKFSGGSKKAVAPRGVSILLRRYTTGGAVGGRGLVPVVRK